MGARHGPLITVVPSICSIRIHMYRNKYASLFLSVSLYPSLDPGSVSISMRGCGLVSP